MGCNHQQEYIRRWDANNCGNVPATDSLPQACCLATGAYCTCYAACATSSWFAAAQSSLAASSHRCTNSGSSSCSSNTGGSPAPASSSAGDGGGLHGAVVLAIGFVIGVV